MRVVLRLAGQKNGFAHHSCFFPYQGNCIWVTLGFSWPLSHSAIGKVIELSQCMLPWAPAPAEFTLTMTCLLLPSSPHSTAMAFKYIVPLPLQFSVQVPKALRQQVLFLVSSQQFSPWLPSYRGLFLGGGVFSWFVWPTEVLHPQLSAVLGDFFFKKMKTHHLSITQGKFPWAILVFPHMEPVLNQQLVSYFLLCLIPKGYEIWSKFLSMAYEAFHSVITGILLSSVYTLY